MTLGRQCFITLGGNQKKTFATMQKALSLLEKIKGIDNLKVSKVYETTPVSPIPQPNFLNLAVSFETSLPLLPLFEALETLEKKVGKQPKPKVAPRLIDVDLLFYGNLKFDNDRLKVPHPFWNQRLFVLIPLLDLTDCHPLDKTIKLQDIINTIESKNNEKVMLLEHLSDQIYEKNKS